MNYSYFYKEIFSLPSPCFADKGPKGGYPFVCKAGGVIY